LQQRLEQEEKIEKEVAKALRLAAEARFQAEREAHGSANIAHRVAFVAGVNNYINPKDVLSNAVSDATSIGSALRANGFNVTLAVDSSLEELTKQLTHFIDERKKLAGDGRTLALFFFAGHGISVEGVNYLLPRDYQAKLHQFPLIFKNHAVSIDDVLAQMCKADEHGVNILVFDACRGDPFVTRGPFRGGFRFMDTTKVKQESFIAFSTSPGTTAQDGTAGTNSPFTSALSSLLLENVCYTVEYLFKMTRKLVVQATGGAQTPWDNSNLQSRILLPCKLRDTSTRVPSLDVPANTSDKDEL
jgi:uncharacterized caspase-like protein